MFFEVLIHVLFSTADEEGAGLHWLGTIVPSLGEIVSCDPSIVEYALKDEVFGDQESCSVITCFCCKMKIIQLPIVLSALLSLEEIFP